MDLNSNPNAMGGDSRERAVANKEKGRPLFEDVGGQADSVHPNSAESISHPAEEDDPRLVDEIESLCMNCQKNVGVDHLDGRNTRRYSDEMLTAEMCGRGRHDYC